MTKIEKQMTGALVVALIALILSVASLLNAIEEAGGPRTVIVETGKEIKSIVKEISEDGEQ